MLRSAARISSVFAGSALAASVCLGVVASPSPATATDSLAVPISQAMAEASFPVRVQIEIVPTDAADDSAGPTEAATNEIETDHDTDGDTDGDNDGTPLPKRTIVVPDGHRLSFNTSVRRPHGRVDFDLQVVPRAHPQGAIELEWDLLVSEAKFRPMDVGGYVMHRLQLAGEPELGPAALSIARSDIVSTTGETFVEEVEIGDESYEIRILAESLRG